MGKSGNGWIDIVEKMPDEEGVFLVCIQDGDNRCVERGVYYDNVNGKGCFSVNGEFPIVTHWMPMPEPPPLEERDFFRLVSDGSVIFGDGRVILSDSVPEGTIAITDGKYRVEITNLEIEHRKP